MIYVKCRFWTVDNCGAKFVECIKVLNKKKQQGAICDNIIVAVKTARPRKKVKKHDVQKAIIVRAKKKLYRNYLGYSLWFDKNCVVIIDKKNNPLGNRLKGSLCQELRPTEYLKLVTMCSSLL